MSKLVMLAFKGEEGIKNTYTCKVKYKDFVNYFQVADTNIAEIKKMQRDTTAAGYKSIAKYLTNRSNTFFPQVIIITNGLKVISKIGSNIYKVALEKNSSLHIIDGQGRRLGIEAALSFLPQLAERHIDLKIIVSDKAVLEDDSAKIKQCFTDLHRSVVKPNASTRIFFDNETPIHQFATFCCSQVRVIGQPLHAIFSLLGDSKPYKLDMLLKMIKILLANYPGSIASCLAQPTIKEEVQADLSALFSGLSTNQAFQVLLTDDWRKEKESIARTALFLEALALLANDIKNSPALRSIKDINFAGVDFNRENKCWLNVCI
ncbi:DGQHR domain-containing protein, partial [Photobacterium sp. ZSDE20]|nr:DGQHR domain-containing protein [Photobacterium sp. ZSDE20]